MNRAKKQMPARLIKKQKKEVRLSPQATAPEEVKKEISTWKILTKFPKKIAQKDLSYVKSMQKGVGAKKAKRNTRHRRTTPGQVEQDITPYTHIHRESKKDIKRVEKQSRSKARRLQGKLLKTPQ